MKVESRKLKGFPSWNVIKTNSELIPPKNEPTTFIQNLLDNEEISDNAGKIVLLDTAFSEVSKWDIQRWDRFEDGRTDKLIFAINNETYHVELELIKKINGRNSLVSSERIFEMRLNIPTDIHKQWNRLFKKRGVSILRAIFLTSQNKTVVIDTTTKKERLTYEKYMISIFDKSNNIDDLTDVSAVLLSNHKIKKKVQTLGGA
ncbi:MAG: hypothetical protein LBV67_08180 [Streptococcaceae bacterium]|jgi:hypothetical protein|nr:hypothetical protein [Streptococcaceae bacterium]